MPKTSSKSIDGLSSKKAPAKKTRKPAAKGKTADAVNVKVRVKKPTAAQKAKVVKEPTAAELAVEDSVVKETTADAPNEFFDAEPQDISSDEISAEISQLEQIEPESVDVESISKKTEKSQKNHSLASKIICGLLVLAEAITGGMLIYSLLRINILADWQNITAIAVIILLFAFTARKLTKKNAKNVTRIICGILAFILTIIYCIGFYYLTSVIGFLQKITTVDNTETQAYSVVVYKDSNIKSIDKLAGKTIGFQSTNLHMKLAEDKLKETINYKKVEHADLASLFLGMDDGSINAIAMATNYLEVLSDDAEEYYKKLKVIYTYDIEFEKETKQTAKIDMENEPFVVYISGTDSRTGIKTVARSDVNMLAVVNPKKNKILLVSVPRDFYVQLHGTTGKKDKLTHAGIYGIDMSKNTMSDLFGGVEIAHTIKVSFGTVENIVNAIDGIDLYSDQSFTARGNRECHIPKGYIHLDGKCALAFSRERYAYASGDRHRVQNQQDVLSAILKKVTTVQHIVNYPRILSAIEGTFQTSLSYDEITGFAKMQMNTMKGWEVEEYSVNGAGSMQPTYSMGSQPLYVMIPDQNTVNEAISKIQNTLKK